MSEPFTTAHPGWEIVREGAVDRLKGQVDLLQDRIANVSNERRRQMKATLKFRRRAKLAEAKMDYWQMKFSQQTQLMLLLSTRLAEAEAEVARLKRDAQTSPSTSEKSGSA